MSSNKFKQCLLEHHISIVTNLIVPKAVTESKQNLPYHLSEPQEPNMRFSAGLPQSINIIKN